MSQRISLKLLLSTTLATFVAAQETHGDEAATMRPYIADDVAAVAFVDLAEIDVKGVLDRFGPLTGASADQLTQAARVARGVQSQIEQFRELGLRHVYVLFRVSDVAYGGPTWVAPAPARSNARHIISLLKQLLAGQAEQHGAWFPRHFVVANGYVLAASTPEQLEKLKAGRHEPHESRTEACEAVEELARHGAGLAIFGDADSRRVIREMFPQLPAPFETIDGRLIADDIRWGALTLDLPPNLQVRAVLQSSNRAKAKIVEDAIVTALETGRDLLREHIERAPDDIAAGFLQAVGMLRPQVDGARVSLTLGEHLEEVAAMANLLAQPVRATAQSVYRKRRMQQFKRIALAFHNYHNREKSFPAPAIYDEGGRPLLSWRVALLPFVDEKALYDQFRIEEPWDSEHNRRLMARMPEIYADPDPSVRRTADGEGRTTYVVPTGERTVFDGREGMKVQEIRDGTSNTILAVEVVPQRAVIWTKPVDWRVDWNDPLDGVRRSDGRPFTAITCDGAAHTIDNDIGAETWTKMLTPAGAEVIEWRNVH